MVTRLKPNSNSLEIIEILRLQELILKYGYRSHVTMAIYGQ